MDLVQQVVDIAATYAEVWDQAAQLVAKLDALAGFADLAAESPTLYVRPTMLPATEWKVVLLGSRHPCVEMQDDMEFIKNDASLVPGDSLFTIVTGPNMGGKSTFIR